MERTPDKATPDEPEQSGTPDQDPKKKKRSATIAGSSVLSTPKSSEGPKTATPAPNAFEQLLARLAATEAGKARSEQKSSGVESVEPVAVTDNTAETADDDSSTALTGEDQATEQWADTFESRPLPSAYSTGEMLFDLSGDTDIHELPLHTPEELDEVTPVYRPVVERAEATEELPLMPEAASVIPATPSLESAPDVPAPAAPESSVPLPAEIVPAVRTNEMVQPAETIPYLTDLGNPDVQQHIAAANVITSQQPEQAISRDEFEDAVHRATKVGQSRGLITGLLVGGLYEHSKHKYRVKKERKHHQATVKKLSEARKNYAFGAEQQAKQRSEYMTQTVESSEQLAATQRRVSELERQRQLYPSAEQQTLVANKRAERMMQQMPENEQLAVAPENRLQRDSWLSTEVDKVTGHAVENPAFQYGHEYYREKAQENALGLPPAQDTFEQKVPVARSHDNRTFNQTSDRPTSPATSLQSVASIAPTSPAPSQPAPEQQLVPKATQVLTKPTQQASPIWPLILALLAVGVCLSLALR